jgi:hypothetical protein
MSAVLVALMVVVFALFALGAVLLFVTLLKAEGEKVRAAREQR